MEKNSAAKLVEAVGRMPAKQLRLVAEISDLRPEEIGVLREAVERFPIEIRDLADRILDSWQSLSVPERTAALLALAAGLARVAE